MGRVEEADRMRQNFEAALSRVLPGRSVETFGNIRRAEVGAHEASEGVQWHCGVELRDSQWMLPYFGVNLEGILYGDWRPIRDLIEREPQNEVVWKALERFSKHRDIEVILNRDAYPCQGRGRPVYYEKRSIVGKPLSRLSRVEWLDALGDARGCFDAEWSPLERQITLTRGGSHQSGKPYRLVPSLHLHRPLDANPLDVGALVTAMRPAMDELAPLYDAVAGQLG